MGGGAETGTELQKVSSNSPQILTKKNYKAKSCSIYLRPELGGEGVAGTLLNFTQSLRLERVCI